MKSNQNKGEYGVEVVIVDEAFNRWSVVVLWYSEGTPNSVRFRWGEVNGGRK